MYDRGARYPSEAAVPVPQGRGRHKGDDSRIAKPNEFKLVRAGRSTASSQLQSGCARGWASEQCTRNEASGGDTVVSSGASFLCENGKVRNLRGRYSVSSEADFLSHRKFSELPCAVAECCDSSARCVLGRVACTRATARLAPMTSANSTARLPTMTFT